MPCNRRCMASQQLGRTMLPATQTRTRSELLVCAILAILIWPVVAVGVVGGWGFAVWMYQQVNGPPARPGGLPCHVPGLCPGPHQGALPRALPSGLPPSAWPLGPFTSHRCETDGFQRLCL